jgi:hypothetical protein
LTNLIDGLIKRAAILRILESGNPGPVNPNVVCCVAGRKPGRTLIGTDAVADIREALEIGEVEPIGSIDGERGIAAPNAGRGLAESGKITGHKMEALAVISRAPYEAGRCRKAEWRSHIDSILRINGDAGFAGNPLMIDDDFSSENKSLGCSAYAWGEAKK